ncbi:MAG: hypothetical protein FD169_2554 [Bacillota bacterium]|nr:MAG: hypothetical protein FD169_2554 [Bacillota bacterium]
MDERGRVLLSDDVVSGKIPTRWRQIAMQVDTLGRQARKMPCDDAGYQL